MRDQLRKIIRIICCFVSVSAMLSLSPKHVKAYGAKEALTTVGISAACGAVLGLSTISFYAVPTAHFKNVLYGAGVGIIAGVAIAAYEATVADGDGLSPDEYLVPQPKAPKKDEKKDPATNKSPGTKAQNATGYRFVAVNSIPNTLAKMALRQGLAMTSAQHGRMDLALDVFELRF